MPSSFLGRGGRAHGDRRRLTRTAQAPIGEHHGVDDLGRDHDAADEIAECGAGSLDLVRTLPVRARLVVLTVSEATVQ